MTARRTLSTAGRVLAQLRGDRRTVVPMLVVPVALLCLLKWVWPTSRSCSTRWVYPSWASSPSSRCSWRLRWLCCGATVGHPGTAHGLAHQQGDLILGYQLAFGAFATVQALIAAGVALLLLDLDVAGPAWAVVVVAVLVGLLGTALGLA